MPSSLNPPSEPFNLLRDVVIDLQLPIEVEKRVREWLIDYYEENPTTRRQPKTILAALLYQACQKEAVFLSRRTIATTMGISLDWLNSRINTILKEGRIAHKL